MLHRHPVLSLLTGAYLALVAWITLIPQSAAGERISIIYRALDALHRRGLLLSVDDSRLEFLANVALFVPVGMFLLLLFGTRRWWLAVGSSFAITMAIEFAQRVVPGRVPDERDLVANGAGALIGVLITLLLTAPAALRRHRGRRLATQPDVPVGAGRTAASSRR